MKRHVFFAVILFLAVPVFFMGCGGVQVTRLDPNDTTDVSGPWNDSDSRMVADEMIRDCLERPWSRRYAAKHGGTIPTVIVGRVRNKSSEHINEETFVKNLEKALINSGYVQFVASDSERGGIRKERLDQGVHASDVTMKGPGEEIGADYMLIGSINTIRDEVEGTAVMYYQVNLELINMANNVKAWIGEKKIKKLIKRPRWKAF